MPATNIFSLKFHLYNYVVEHVFEFKKISFLLAFILNWPLHVHYETFDQKDIHEMDGRPIMPAAVLNTSLAYENVAA